MGTTHIAWCCEPPTAEAARIAGLISFFNERVDALLVDGIEVPRSRTQRS